METSIRYRGDGQRRIWFIPFPYGCASDVGVSILEDGLERPVADWQELEHCVIYPVPAGAVISIWRCSSDVVCEAGQLARVSGAAQACAAEPAPAVSLVSEPAQTVALMSETAPAVALMSESAPAAETQAASAAGVRLLQDAADQEVERLQEIMDEDLSQARSAFQSDVSDELDDFRESVGAIERESLLKIAAAANVEIARTERPGIRALPSLRDIMDKPPIFYVINSNLAEATATLGLFPVQRLEDVLWDGFFFILPGCWGHTDRVDVSFPGAPGRPAEAGRDNWWQPCNHTHLTNIEEADNESV